MGLSHSPVNSRESVRNLERWAFATTLSIFVLVPLVFNPLDILVQAGEAFYLSKFTLLMCLTALLLAMVLGSAFTRVNLVKVPLLIPSLTLLCVAILSAVSSGKVLRSLMGSSVRFDGLLSLGAGILLFYAVALFSNSWWRIRLFLAGGVVSATLVSVYGILQKFDLDPIEGRAVVWGTGLRAFSTIGNALFLAAYLTLMMGVTIALYFLTEARWKRVLLLTALALIGVCWAYTHARGAALGVMLACPIILWLSYRRMGTVKPLLMPIAVLFMTVMAATGLANLAETGEVRSSSDESLSVTIRLLIWRDTLPMILERPFFGHGPDNFLEPFGRFEGEDLKVASTDPATGQHSRTDKAHNEFLQVAATTGLLSLAAYLWIFVSYFHNSYRNGGWPVIALSGGVLAYILQLQTSFSTIATSTTFWAILGVSVAIMRLQNQGAKRVSPSESSR